MKPSFCILIGGIFLCTLILTAESGGFGRRPPVDDYDYDETAADAIGVGVAQSNGRQRRYYGRRTQNQQTDTDDAFTENPQWGRRNGRRGRGYGWGRRRGPVCRCECGQGSNGTTGFPVYPPGFPGNNGNGNNGNNGNGNGQGPTVNPRGPTITPAAGNVPMNPPTVVALGSPEEIET